MGLSTEPLPGWRTRLIVGGYWAFEPRWLQPAATILLYEWTHWIMQTRQFQNLKRSAEAAAMRAPGASSPTLPGQ